MFFLKDIGRSGVFLYFCLHIHRHVPTSYTHMDKYRILSAPLLCLAVFGKIQAQRYGLVAVEAQRIEVTRTLDFRPDTAAVALLTPYKTIVDSITAPVLGYSTRRMEVRRPESALSNWVADVLRDAAARLGKPADIGLCNMGGLRSSMPQGPVKVGDVLAIAPFENHLCILTLRGDALQELMEQIAATGGEGISGAQLEITADGKLTNAAVAGCAIDPEHLYTIATISYLAEGNDRMYALRKATEKDQRDILISQVMMDYIRAEHKAGRKLKAETEGRILIK